MNARLAVLAAAAALALPVTACSTPDRSPQIPTTPTASSAGSAPAASSSTPSVDPRCNPANPGASYQPPASQPPPGSMPAGTLMETIQKRGYVLVGTSSDTRLLSDRNLSTNNYEGFDIEMAKAVAQAIFGDTSTQHLRFRAITAGDRVKLVNAGGDRGGVDLVARAMTVNCQRWAQVKFSEVYFQATQQVLVHKGAKETTLKELGAAKKKVCATNGSTTIESLKKIDGIQPVGVAYTTDCMALWQQGQVDAISADDAILAGLAAQDPLATVPRKENIEQEPYGLAVASTHPEFARFINGVLERMRTDGGWLRAYRDSGLQTYLPNRSQPKPNFSRTYP